MPSGIPYYLVMTVWDIEDALAGQWYSTFVHLLDGNNELYGHADYIRVKADAGVQPGPLTVSGGANFKLSDLTTAGGVGAATVAPSSSVPSSLPGSVLRAQGLAAKPYGPLPRSTFRMREAEQPEFRS